MEQSDTRSLQQLKRETEQTRANLLDTVEQLRANVSESASDIRERIRPDAIKSEVSQYLRTRAEQLLEDAKRNPMQAVALGASVGYPLLRMARAIPLPVWMMGAGLFLAKSSTGQSLTKKATDAASDLSNTVAQRTREISDRAADAVSTAKSVASEKVTRLTDAVTGVARYTSDEAAANLAAGSEQLQQKTMSFGAAATDASASIREQVGQTGSAAATNVRDMASDAASAGRKAVETSRNMGLQAARTVQETASNLTERASNLGQRAGKTFSETVEQNPLLVAGVGLFIGGLIASAIPRSGIEDSLMGEAKNSVKRQADRAAAGAVRTAKEAAGEGYDEAVRQAQAEGLTPDGLSEAARDVGERLRHVAEAAVTTAFEPAQNGNDHQQRNTHGEKDHG
ncbi:MAG TPA: hypothetical protein VHM22_11110 [Bradyrhizobium sp.]|jgi:hypothetical protein|nr:hypothetical protein [Bradyrhizobium sp.]